MVHMHPARRIALAPEDFTELFSSLAGVTARPRRLSHLASTALLLSAVLLDVDFPNIASTRDRNRLIGACGQNVGRERDHRFEWVYICAWPYS